MNIIKSLMILIIGTQGNRGFIPSLSSVFRNTLNNWIASISMIASLLTLNSCTEELLDAKSSGTSFKILQNGNDLDGNRIFSPSKDVDGSFQFYYLENNAPAVSKTKLDADGNFLNQTTPQDEEQSGPVDVVTAEQTDFSIAFNNSASFITLFAGGFELAAGRLRVTGNNIFKAELRFGPGLSQKAHRFLVPVGATVGVPNGSYSYQDYVDVPFQVWDVTNNRQLMVSFRDQGRDGAFNLIEYAFPPDALLHSREYVFIHDVAYSGTPDPGISVNGGMAINRTYFFWPMLASGGVWDPNALPASSMSIIPPFRVTSEISVTYQPFDYSSGYNLIVTTNTSSDLLVAAPFNTGTGQINGDEYQTQLITLTLYDKDWNVKQSRIVNSIKPANGNLAVSGIDLALDGGILLSTSVYDYYDTRNRKIKFARLNSDLTTDYELSFDQGEFNSRFGIANFNGNVRFFEKAGQTYFLFEAAYTNARYFFSMSPTGVEKLGQPSFPGISNIKSAVASSSQFAVLDYNGKVYLFDENLNTPQIITLPDLGVTSNLNFVSRTYNLISVDGQLYFTAYLYDPFNQITREPKLVLGSINQTGSVTSKSLGLGSNIVSCASSFSPGGTGVHILQIQSSEKVKNLILLETDALFDLQNKN